MEALYKTLEIIQKIPNSRVYNIYLNKTPPLKSALSRDFFTEFPLALSSLDQNPDVSIIMLSAHGNHFCSGIDIHTLNSITTTQSNDPGRNRERLRHDIKGLQDAITAIEQCRKPVIAALHGACIGGGIDIVTACDIRYCTEDAFFSVKEVDLGLTADLGILQRLPWIVGYGNVAELALTGRRFSGLEAKSLGLVSRVFGDKNAMEEGVRALAKDIETFRVPVKSPTFSVIGHRGSGMNMLQSSDRRVKAIKENTILSFNAAGKFPIDYVEFDVQVTRDDCLVIFHDNFISSEENGAIVEKRVTELTLAEFLSYGPQREPGQPGKSLTRKTKDGKIFPWMVEQDEGFCTLQEAFQKVDPSLGFNAELKFDDSILYGDEELIHALQEILKVVFEFAKQRPIIFSSFQPDAARLMGKLQNTYPVYFVTNGGTEIYKDVRRNSLDEALKLCIENGMHGIVSKVNAIFRNPGAIAKIKESNLALLTYGELNNVPEAVQMQHLMGVDGVIVDLVREITEAVYDFVNKPAESMAVSTKRLTFSRQELSFLLRLIPELIQH